MGIKLDPQTSSSSKSKSDTKEAKEKQPASAKPAPGVVVVVGAGSEMAPKPTAVTSVAKKEDPTALSSLLSPPPTVSVSVYNQASPMTMPLLTPPSPPPPKTIAPVTTTMTEQTDNSDNKQQTPSETVVKEKDNKPIVNGEDKLEQSSNTATNSNYCYYFIKKMNKILIKTTLMKRCIEPNNIRNIEPKRRQHIVDVFFVVDYVISDIELIFILLFLFIDAIKRRERKQTKSRRNHQRVEPRTSAKSTRDEQTRDRYHRQ